MQSKQRVMKSSKHGPLQYKTTNMTPIASDMVYAGHVIVRKLSRLPHILFRAPLHVAVAVETSDPNWLVSYTEYGHQNTPGSEIWKLLRNIHTRLTPATSDSFVIESINQMPMCISCWGLSESKPAIPRQQIFDITRSMHFVHRLPPPGRQQTPPLMFSSAWPFLCEEPMTKTWSKYAFRNYNIRAENPIVCTEFIHDSVKVFDGDESARTITVSDMIIQISIKSAMTTDQFNVVPTLSCAIEYNK